MMLIDRGFLVMPHSGEEISRNDQQERGLEFLKSLIQPYVEGVWVRVYIVSSLHTHRQHVVPYVVQVVCHHLVMFSGGVQSLTTTIRGAQTLAIKCIHGGTVHLD